MVHQLCCPALEERQLGGSAQNPRHRGCDRVRPRPSQAQTGSGPDRLMPRPILAQTGSGPERLGPSLRRTAQNSALLFPSPAPSFVLVTGGRFVEFGGIFAGVDPQMSTFGLSSLKPKSVGLTRPGPDSVAPGTHRTCTKPMIRRT